MLRVALLTGTLLGSVASAQWLNYPAPGVPRLADGKPNLSAPAPHAADGKPDRTHLSPKGQQEIGAIAADEFLRLFPLAPQ